MASEIVYQAVFHRGGLRLVVIGRGPIYYLPCPARSTPAAELRYRPDLRDVDRHAIAASILTDCLGEEGTAHFWGLFADQVVAGLPAEGWELTGSEISRWLRGASDEACSPPNNNIGGKHGA
jgi:hypothetical protein